MGNVENNRQDYESLILSRDYKIYRKERRKRLSWYESLALFCGRILDVSPDKGTEKELNAAINFTGMSIKPKDVMALVVLTFIFFSMLSAIIFSLTFSISLALLFLMLGIGMGYYFLKYPVNLLKSYRIKASSEVVLAVLYMVVSMRVSPNLERALRFAASNISGPLAWDMRRMLWDIEMGKYYSANDALTDYIAKWKPENEEFAEALRLIRDSQYETPESAEKTLNEALNVILDGTKTRMKHYAQELRTPVMVIHMMGIMLPVLGSIIAPMAAIFLADIARPEYFIISYNVILPVSVMWFINTTLKKRPTTFSEVDISAHPELPPENTFSLTLGKKRIFIPSLPLSLLITFLILLFPIYYFSSHPAMLFSAEKGTNILTLSLSLLITLGIGFGIGCYFLLSTFQRIKIQRSVQETESEFELALFQLGNRISAGTPTELALEKSINDIKDLNIAGLFSRTLKNIRSLGMTFGEALFDPKYGAINYYPSMMIRNIMYMIVDITKQGFRYAADAMLTISRYLRTIRETQEYIRDMLSESVSSMTFQAYFLTPMVTGLIVSLSHVIITILTILTQKIKSMSGYASISEVGMLGITGNALPISPQLFQLIAGIYLIEIIIVLAFFVTKITEGENKTYQWYLAGKMLLVALVMYMLITLLSTSLFGGIIEQAVKNMIGGKIL